MSEIPDAGRLYPLDGIDRLVFLRPLISNPLIEVGDYTYYDNPAGPERFEEHVLYHFDFIGDRLRIGRFCQIAAETIFIMNGGNHRMAGFSAFPFPIFGGRWSGRFEGETDFPDKGDMTIGNDVWIGFGATLMPGISVGDGAIIGARAVVTEDVPPYAVVAGNPARVTRMRFDAETVQCLLEIRWWDWDIERITRSIPQICGNDIEALREARQG